jgi:hypothetical protein
MRGGWVLMAILVVASLARAEGVGSAPASESNDRRLNSVVGLRPTHGGLISNGGASLRRLAPGSRRWETLHA